MKELLPKLDYLEEYNQPNADDMYKRILSEAKDNKGNSLMCYLYIWAPEREEELLEHGKYIKEGDWKKFYQTFKKDNRTF